MSCPGVWLICLHVCTATQQTPCIGHTHRWHDACVNLGDHRRRWRWSRSKELKRQLARCPCWSMAQSSPTSSSWVACWCNPGCSSLSLALPPSLCYRMAYLHMTKIMLRKMLNCYIITYIIWNPYYNILIGIKGWNIEFQVKKYFVI